MNALTQSLSNMSIGRKLNTYLATASVVISACFLLALIWSFSYINEHYLVPSQVNSIQQILNSPLVSEHLIDPTPETHQLIQGLVEHHSLLSCAGIYSADKLRLFSFCRADTDRVLDTVLEIDTLEENQSLFPLRDNLHLLVTRSDDVPESMRLGVALLSMVIMTLIILLLLFFSQVLRRFLTEPIVHLIKIAHSVSIDENYSVRAQRQFNDEVGSLATSFNTMLARIESRDQQLTSARDKAQVAGHQAQILAQETRRANKKLELEIQVRTHIEHKLTGLQNYLSNIIDSMPSALIAINDQLQIQQWNNEASRLFEIGSKEANNRHIGDVVPMLNTYIPDIREAVSQLKTHSIDKLAYQTQEHEKFLSIVIYPLTGDMHSGAVIRIDDISSRLHMEEMVVQSEKMVSVGALAAGMAHEINNPLGGIIQGAQNIHRRISMDLPKNLEVADALEVDLDKLNAYLDERGIIRFLENIHDAGTRASTIVSNMLQFSRRSERVLNPVNLSELVERTIAIAHSDQNIKESSLEISTELDERLDQVPCISNEIEQVLLNLIKNATHAIESREDKSHPGQIKIRTYIEGKFAKISVEDNGTGMSEKVRKRIFEPFFTTKDVGDGTGLGLSVCFFIIKSNHKGTMVVRSTKGFGTIFKIGLLLSPNFDA